MYSSARFYLPRRTLTTTNCQFTRDYPEVGTKFKAAHIKVMCWWIAYKVEQLRQKHVACLQRPISCQNRPPQARLASHEIFKVLSACTWSFARVMYIMDESSLLMSETDASVS